MIGFNISDRANAIAMNVKTQEVTSTLDGNPEDIMVDISPFSYMIPLIW